MNYKMKPLHLLLSYIGSKKTDAAPKSQSAAAPWSGGFLSGIERRVAGRPEPLWRPAGEEQERVPGPSQEVSKPSVATPFQENTSPPSPRTLKAIQAAMNESSDEEKLEQVDNGGRLSPRTLLAIQQALTEEDHGSAEQINDSGTSLKVNIPHPAQQVVISSSEEEPEPSCVNSVSHEKSDLKEPLCQTVPVRDSLFVSSSEDEMEEVIGQRNKALRSALLKPPHDGEVRSAEEPTKGLSIEDSRSGSEGRTEKEEELVRRVATTRNGDVVPPLVQSSLSTSSSAQMSEDPLRTEAESDAVKLEQGRKETADVQEKRIIENPEPSEESESEGAAMSG